MRKATMCAMWAVVMFGCEDDTVGVPGGSGDSVMVTCEASTQPTYEHGCEDHFTTNQCDPLLDLCLPQNDGTFAGTLSFCQDTSNGEDDDAGAFGAEMANLCAAECPDAVRDQACDLGRYAENIQGCDTFYASWQTVDCTTEAKLVQELEVTYHPPVGDPMSVSGSVSYTLDKPGRSGRGGMIWSIDIDSPLQLTGGLKDATVLLGYPEGTTIEVRSVALKSAAALDLDSDDAGTLRDGMVSIRADVTVTEPNSSPRTLPLLADVPMTLDIVASDDGLSIDKVSGPLGGTFVFEGSSSTKR